MTEVNSEQATRIRLLVANGTSPDQAIAEVVGERAEPQRPATPKKANTEPATKKQLAAWLHDRVPHGAVETEFKFHPTRRWRIDFFLPAFNIAIEYDGLMAHGSNQGHASIGGILKDVEKSNHLAEAGIRLFRANAKNVADGSFFELMERVLGEA